MQIRFINHASLLLSSDSGEHLLTDPWYLSPAFGGWVQRPPPPAEAIKEVLALPQDNLHVVVSHGHDDHLDEFFVRQHLRDAHFYVPAFKADGLARRIERLTGRYPTLLTSKATQAGAFALNGFINPDFTLYDAIVTIRSGGQAVIHANDNWHAWPAAVLDDINGLLMGVSPNDRALFVQFGIADCFPVNYPEFGREQVLDHIRARFAQYRAASLANLAGLGLERGFFYANQSIYPYPASWDGPSLYEMAQDYLREHPAPYRQCQPGTDVGANGPWIEPTPGLFEFCLQRLEDRLAGMLKTAKVWLLTSGRTCPPGEIAYEAAPQVWARILIGELTLESIAIGGLGLVHKPPERNISDVHAKVSKLSYFIQSQIEQQGLRFYFGEGR